MLNALANRAICAIRLTGLGSLALLVSLLTTCATVAPLRNDAARLDPPRFVAPEASKRPQIALVLSGGSARGFAHLGVLRVLEREGLRPDIVVGTSAGAIIGALYASGQSVKAMELLAQEIDGTTIFDFDPVRALLGGFTLGLARGDRFEAWLALQLTKPIQSFPMRFAAVATDMQTGATAILNHGNAALAVRASASIPAILEPVKIGDRMLADGQIVSPLPVNAARLMGAQVVIAIDVVYPPDHSAMTNPLSMLFQTMLISSYRLLELERDQADLVISPAIKTIKQLGFRDRDWLIESGAQAAEKALPAIRAAFAASSVGTRNLK